VGRAVHDDPAVIAITTLYLRTVAPFYAVFGIGMTLYLRDKVHDASVADPAGTARLILAGVLGVAAAAWFQWLSPACSRWCRIPVLFGASSSAY
jgi:hypothetical protein